MGEGPGRWPVEPRTLGRGGSAWYLITLVSSARSGCGLTEAGPSSRIDDLGGLKALGRRWSRPSPPRHWLGTADLEREPSTVTAGLAVARRTPGRHRKVPPARPCRVGTFERGTVPFQGGT